METQRGPALRSGVPRGLTLAGAALLAAVVGCGEETGAGTVKMGAARPSPAVTEAPAANPKDATKGFRARPGISGRAPGKKAQ